MVNPNRWLLISKFPEINIPNFWKCDKPKYGCQINKPEMIPLSSLATDQQNRTSLPGGHPGPLDSNSGIGAARQQCHWHKIGQWSEKLGHKIG
jgi:hypothetical protein